MNNWINQGWECPKCGAVMSLTTSVCVNCRGNTNHNITTTPYIDDTVSLEDILKQYNRITGEAPEAYLKEGLTNGS